MSFLNKFPVINLPKVVVYTDNLPENVGGRTNAFVVRIKNKYRDDAGIHAHEYEHVRQWYVGVLLGLIAALALITMPGLAAWAQLWPVAIAIAISLPSVAYAVIPAYKLWAEVKAYQVQAGYYADDRKPLFAQFISANYGLDITPEAALTLLRKK